MSIYENYKPILRLIEETRTSGAAVALSYIGNILACVYFFTPSIQIIRAYDKSLERDMFPLSLIIFIILNCLLWLLNAFSSGNILDWIPLIISNGFGIVINITILFLFLNLLLGNNRKKFAFYGCFVINVLIQITYGIFRFIIIKDKENKEKEQSESGFHYIGLAATFINVLMYLSPIFNVLKLFQTKNSDFLPIFTLGIGFLSTFVFLIQGIVSYNFYDKDNEKDQKKYALETIISNGLSIFVIVCQIIIWLYYYITNKDKDKVRISNLDSSGQNKLDESNENL